MRFASRGLESPHDRQKAGLPHGEIIFTYQRSSFNLSVPLKNHF